MPLTTGRLPPTWPWQPAGIPSRFGRVVWRHEPVDGAPQPSYYACFYKRLRRDDVQPDGASCRNCGCYSPLQRWNRLSVAGALQAGRNAGAITGGTHITGALAKPPATSAPDLQLRHVRPPPGMSSRVAAFLPRVQGGSRENDCCCKITWQQAGQTQEEE